jgi:hypothetical protein
MQVVFKKTEEIKPKFLKEKARAFALALEAPPRFELGNRGFAVHCLTTWLWRHCNFLIHRL